MMKGFNIAIVIVAIIVFCNDVNGKKVRNNVFILYQDTIVFMDDSVLHVNLDEVKVKPYKKRSGKYYRYTQRYWRTVRNIRVVYPYAQAANETIKKLSLKLQVLESKKERRKLIRNEYKGLMKEYKKPLMRLKFSQGRLLLKLIDRETGNTSYNHLKELKGSFTAAFWQSVATMFGSSLKAEYDPLGDDWMVEEILERMKRNELQPPGDLPMRRIN